MFLPVSEVKCPETEDLDYMIKHYYTLKTYLKLNTNSFNPRTYKGGGWIPPPPQGFPGIFLRRIII